MLLKGQSSIEYLAVVVLGFLMAAPFIGLVQQDMISLQSNSQDAQFGTSLDKMESSIERANAFGEPAETSFVLNMPPNIVDSRIVDDRIIIFTQNRSGRMTNHSIILDNDVQAYNLPIERGKYRMKAKADDGFVRLSSPDIISGLSWNSQADWDSANSRSRVVTRNIGDRSGDEIRLGFDSEYSPLTDSLEMYLTFDEDGDPIVDYSGNNNDASLMGDADLDEDGLLGSSGAGVDGDNNFFEAKDDDSLDIEEELTLSVWYNPSDQLSSWEGLIGKGDTTYQMRHHNDDRYVTFNVRRDDGNDILSGDGISGLNTNQEWTENEWNLATGTYSSIDEIGHVYHNGVQENSDTGSSQIRTSDADLQIGANYDDDNDEYRRFWEGGIEEVMIWSRALTEDEVEELWNTTENGRLESSAKSGGFEAEELVSTSTVPSNTEIEVTVYQDVNDDGAPDNQETIALNGGSDEINSLSGFDEKNSDYWFEVELFSNNREITPVLQDVSIRESS